MDNNNEHGKYAQMMNANLIVFALFSNISTAITSICIVLGALIMLVQFIKTGNIPRPDKKITSIVAIFLLIWFVLCFFSQDILVSLKGLWGYAYRFLPLFMVIMYVKTIKQLLYLIEAFAVSVMIDDVYFIFQEIKLFLSGVPLKAIRPSAFNHSPTFVASYMLMAIPVLAIMSQNINLDKKYRISMLTLSILSVLVLFLSQTRGAWLAFPVIILAAIVIAKKYRKKLIVISLLMGIILSVFVLTSASLSERFSSISNPATFSVHQRFLMWDSAVNMFKDYPVTGVGMEMYGPIYLEKYIHPDEFERMTHPHNNYLKILTEGGIIGFSATAALHLYIMLLFFKHLRICNMNNDFAIIAILMMLGIHLEGITDTTIHNVPIMREYWLLIGICYMGSTYLLKNNKI